MRSKIGAVGALGLGACAAIAPHATPAPPHDAGPPMDGNIHYVYEGPDAAHLRDAGPDPAQGRDTGLDAPSFIDATTGCVEMRAGCASGSFARGTLCCPCTSSDCRDPMCCDAAVCAGTDTCRGFVCRPLPPSCGGIASSDCDDFPEDCDDPCCACRDCP